MENKDYTITDLKNLIEEVKIQIQLNKELNMERGLILIRWSMFFNVLIGLFTYFFLKVGYKYLIYICLFQIIIILIITFRVKYVIDKLDELKSITIIQLENEIEKKKSI